MGNFIEPGFAIQHRVVRGWLSALMSAAALFLAGCSLPSSLLGPAPDQVLFEQGVAKLSPNRTPEAFSRLASRYPDSPWTSRAKAIEKVLEQLNAEQRACLEEKDRLAGDVKSLEAYTVTLKSLLGEAGIAEPVLPER